MYPDFNFTLFVILLFFVLMCGLVLYYRKYIATYSKFPKANFLSFVIKSYLLSKIPKNTAVNCYFFQYLVETCKRFKSEGLCIFWIFQPYLIIYSEEAFKIFSNESSTINKPYNFDLFKENLMDSLLTSGGDLWKKRRKMLNPVFYSPNLKQKAELINKNAILLVQNMQKYKNEVSSDILKLLKNCAFRNIYEFLTDLELSADKSNHEVESMIDCVNKTAEMITYRITKPWLHPRCLLFFSSKSRIFKETVENGLKLANMALDRIKESVVHSKMNENEMDELGRNSRRSFGRVIIEQHMKDPTYSTMDMLGETSGMVAAGYDTVSYALIWSLFLLGHHPDVQDQIYEEVESVMGCDNKISYDDLGNLKYLECVIKETLRIYPPVPFYTRRTVKDVQCGKYIVPKGTNIVFFTYVLHRDSNMFPDPEKFNPERFFTENCDDKKIMMYPFAEGVRNCIGKNFALMELKIVLAHIIKNFKITSLDLRDEVDVSQCWEVILTTSKPLRMYLTPR